MTISETYNLYAVCNEMEKTLDDIFSVEDPICVADKLIRLSQGAKKLELSFKESHPFPNYHSRNVFEVINDSRSSFYCLWREHRALMDIYE